MIQVKAPDGTLVQFPDGTSRETMKAAMAKRYGGPEAAPTNPIKAFYEYGKAQGRKALDEGLARRPAVPSLPHPLRAIGHEFMEGARTVGQSYQDQAASGGRPSDVKLFGGLARAALAPITGLQESLVTKPAAQVTGLPESAVNEVLMGAMPAKGRSFAPSAAPRAIPRPPKAELRVARTLQRAGQRDTMAPLDIAARAKAEGVPTYQAGGENLAALAEVTAQSPGPGKQIIIDAVREHQATAPDRVKANIGKGVGGRGDYFATLEAAMEARKARSAPLRDKAFAAPVDPVKYAAEIEPLMGRVPKRALSYAYEIAKRDGLVPEESLGLRATGVDPNGLPIVEATTPQPTMQTLHYVKKGMDADLQGYKNPVTGKLDLQGDPMAAATSNVRSDFGKALRRVNPDYDKFMRVWGDDSAHIDALELGRDVFSPKFQMNSERLANRYAEMNQTERDFYRKGVGEALIAKVRGQGGVPAMRQLLKSEEFRDRVKIAFPHQQSFDDFMASAQREVRMQERNGQIVGNSRTDARGAARADLEAEGGMDPLAMAAEAIDTGLSPARLTAKALKATLEAIPRKDRSILGDPAANEALAKALKDPDEMTRLLNLLEVAKARRLQAPSAGTVSRGLLAAQPVLPKPDR